MTWIRTETGALVNLARVDIVEIAGPTEETPHLYRLMAFCPDSTHITLYTGDLPKLKELRDWIVDIVNAEEP